jgi:hypothetical protein
MKSSDPSQETRPVSIAGLGVYAASGNPDASVIGRGGGPVTIAQANGALQITTTGDLSLGAGIDIHGNRINLKAGKISET